MQDKRTILLSAIAAAILSACAGPQLLPHEPAPVAQLDPKTCPFIAINGALPVQYPAKAYESGQQGWVHLRFDIDAQGVATNVKQLGSSPPGIFDAAALGTLQNARFVTTGAKGCEFVLEYHKDPAK